MIGTTLGHYRITAKLGEGGMGVVYRARDERLDRDVAVKVLLEAVAQDKERMARFEREAKLLAQLNHNNIATLYGLEVDESRSYLVMELVEGETLASRLSRGPLPMDDALTVALQLAEALEAAHEQGIVHRDLKPSNIALTEDLDLKVLDFGLATALAPPSMESDPSESPTLSLGTAVGTILGTAAYMSPEQARGKRVDKRTDIWAFGCCIYEALTGKRPFLGETVSDTLVELLEREPDWDGLPENTPSTIRRLVRRCLEKDQRQRLRDIGEARVAISGASGWADDEQGGAVPSKQAGWRANLVLGLGAAVITGIVVGVSVWLAVRPPVPRVTRLSITLPAEVLPTIAVSPDGTQVVYVGAAGSGLSVRALDELTPRHLTDLGSPSQPFISPDGKWIGFFDGLKSLKKVPMTGGPPVLVCPLGGTAARGASWSPDGTIIFATDDPGTGLWRVPDAGGVAELLTTPKQGNDDHHWPHVLPGGRAVLFTVRQMGLADPLVALLELDSGAVKTLLPGSHPMYVPTGHLIYESSGTLRAVGFDLGQLETVGTSVPVLEQVATTRSGQIGASVANDGTLVYLPGGIRGVSRRLVWVDREGNEELLPVPPGAYMIPRISPDGASVALDNREISANIWIWDFEREAMTRFTFETSAYPVWTPDGRMLVFTAFDKGVGNLTWRVSDGTAMHERLMEGPNSRYPTSITPDGTRLVYREEAGATGLDLAMLTLGSDAPPEPLIATEFNELNAEISPDGRWLAYRSNESGRDEVYVRPFPNVEAALWQVSTDGGQHPVWARSGEELFYRGLDGSLMQMPVELQPRFVACTPTKLFEGPYLRGSGRAYDVSPDGRRFLMIKEGDGPSDDSSPPGIIVVQNWFEELRRLVPED